METAAKRAAAPATREEAFSSSPGQKKVDSTPYSSVRTLLSSRQSSQDFLG